MPTGVLLINLGTPDAPYPKEVRRYLKQFLMDPYVIDIPAFWRWLMVHGLILPKRPAASAEAYQKIWEERGSPLLFHTRDLTAGVRQQLGTEYRVEFGMRYGNPSIESAARKLWDSGARRWVVIPLYPQYSLAATESSRVELERVLERIARAPGRRPEISWVEDFFEEEGMVEAFAEIGRRELESWNPDFYLFSFHGLPERQIRKADATGTHCLASEGCCDRVGAANRRCYRAQSYQSARRIAARLGLPRERYEVSFQSRLGRTPWIKPYTDVMYEELARRGVRRLAVFCPSFVADCLETLEEIRIRGREQFRELGGEDLILVPSLNSDPAWVRTVAGMVRREAGASTGA